MKRVMYTGCIILMAAIIATIVFHFIPKNRQIVVDGSQDQGLSFEVHNPTSSGATVTFVQENGDVKGELCVTTYGLYFKKDYAPVIEINKLEMFLDIPLPKNSHGSFEINWEPAFDLLKPGDYYLGLSVYDETNKERDEIFDHERYYIPFTID